jgi:polysaccharide biosynthesis protein PslH
MKVMILSRTCPYPPNDGEKLRIYNLIKRLSNHDITLICRVMNDFELEGINALKKYCQKVDYSYIPSPKNNVERISWCLPFIFSKYPISLSTIFFTSIQKKIIEYDLDTFDILQVEHSSLSIYLENLNKFKAKKVLTVHNIDYIRYERIKENLNFGFNKIFLEYNNLKYKNWELQSLNLYDVLVAMSEKDKNELLKINGNLNIRVIENGVDINNVSFFAQNHSFNKIVFVASMNSEANHDGAIFFLKEVLPYIFEKLPNIVCYLVGRNPKRELISFHNGTNIFVTGEVEDVFPHYKGAAVSIVPLRSGGGTRLKILESMAVGVPVVSTSIGCEGLDVENNSNIIIADEPKKFAESVISLINDFEMRYKISINARNLVESKYDWDIIAQKNDQLYEFATT